MSMLDRIKKRRYDGFKEFVVNIETTSSANRQHIFLNGVLEDPIFMSEVMKNIRNLEDFLNLPTHEISSVFQTQDQLIKIFAKCVFGWSAEKLVSLERVIPKYVSNIREELSYLNDVSNVDRESSIGFLLKTVRNLQAKELIAGFPWKLPPQDIFNPKIYVDGPVQITFESGLLAAEGPIFRGKRVSSWKHYYDSGQLLAEGEYSDGLKSGLWTHYYINGSKRSEGKYVGDLKHGQWKEWDRSGDLREINYVEGVKVVQSSSK
jgi:hypothetical protein